MRACGVLWYDRKLTCRSIRLAVFPFQIPQFLHYFPTLVESGINAQLDVS